MADDIEQNLASMRRGLSSVPPGAQSATAQGTRPQRPWNTGLQAYASAALRGLATVSLLVGVVSEGPSAYLNWSEWRNARAVADNAAVQQHGDAVTAHADAQKALEKARNAFDRVKAEADQAEAEATKLEHDVVTKQNEALNAKNKAKGDADATAAQAELYRQQALTALAEAQVAATKMKIEADQKEQDLKNVRYNLRQAVYTAGLIHCPGTTYIAKINAAFESNGACSQ